MALSHAALRVASQRAVVALVERLARAGAISQGDGARPQVALTFDDGPHPTWTPRVLDALDRARAKATFFVVGRNAARFPEIVREARRRGHEIGTHLYSHERGAVYDDRRFDDEVRRSDELLQSILGERIRWLRFPYGERGPRRAAEVSRVYRLRAVHWTFSAHDGWLTTPRDVLARVRAGLRPGAIVLLHDALADESSLRSPYLAARDVTVSAVASMGELTAARGLAAVTLSDLLDRRAT